MTPKHHRLILGTDGLPGFPLQTISGEESGRTLLYESKALQENIFSVSANAAGPSGERHFVPVKDYQKMKNFESEFFAVRLALKEYALNRQKEHGYVLYGAETTVRIHGVFAGRGLEAVGAWAYYAYSDAPAPPAHPPRKIRLVSVEIGPGVAREEKTGLIATLRKISRGFKPA